MKLFSIGWMATPALAAVGNQSFQRISLFNICTKFDASCNDDTETVAEIVDATPDGMKLVYTDSEVEEIGFVDITDPHNPVHAGSVSMEGEPTSVAVTTDGMYAVAAVNTSPDFINTSGVLSVIDIASLSVVTSIDLPGQPDSIKVAPQHPRIAIAIENERDEDLGDGEPPQMPPGFLVLIDTSNEDPAAWTSMTVELTGLDFDFPEDPEPEFVDIDDNGMLVMSLQENNGLVIFDVMDGTIVKSGTAGTVDLEMIDTQEEDVVLQVESLAGVPREPDALAWIGNTGLFASSDEGDLYGGSRGFTIFDSDLNVVYSSGNDLDHWVARIGHYNEGRSGNKGNEPEGMAYGNYSGKDIIFVLSERSSVVFVYDVSTPTSPLLMQILPAGVGPEGAKVSTPSMTGAGN